MLCYIIVINVMTILLPASTASDDPESKETKDRILRWNCKCSKAKVNDQMMDNGALRLTSCMMPVKKSWPWNQRQNPEMKLNGKCGKITYWCQQKSETSDDPDSGETKSWDEIATVDFWLLELQRLQSKGKGRQMTDNHRTKCNHCSFQWS